MLKARNKKGFTLAETLIVVAIIAVLAAIAFIGIITHMRNMTKLEYDKYAKEIFIAAQNHLSMAHRQGYPGCDYFGVPEGEDGEEGVYYLVVSKDSFTEGSVLNLMLPFGSIDNTVRMGGQYIIRYHKDSGTVLDVFYWDTDGRYPLKYVSAYYRDLMSYKTNNEEMKKFKDGNSVVGWYGGAEGIGSLIHGEELKDPDIRVVNAEKLYVIVTDYNDESARDSGYTLKLIIQGETSKNSVEVTLPGQSATVHTVLLDDITAEGQHFSDKYGVTLIPGENLKIKAVASYAEKLSNIAQSAEETTNSLFGNDTDTVNGDAEISNIRHLENLYNAISGVNTSPGLTISAARQTANLSWPDFCTAVGKTESEIAVYMSDGVDKTGTFVPVKPISGFTYDGGRFSISGTRVSVSDDAGIFGKLTGGEVKNLKLENCTVSGTNAGALAGSTVGTNVTNVLACNTPDFDQAERATIRATVDAGGLIGSATDGEIRNSAAALLVSGGGNVGGLIGSVSAATVSGCYSGGHTVSGAYSKTAYNVTGATAGGLIGSAGNAGIEYSYSTCSVSGTTAGGFVGRASGGSITNCYSTGLVAGTTRGAFAGSSTGTVSGCYYYKIVNEIPKDGDKGETGYEYLAGGVSGATAFDESISTFNAFANDKRADAKPYDNALGNYYKNKYPLRTYAESRGDFVAAHYGDWPAPETWVINK